MDLHDYKDVAENYDRYLEVMFETNNAHEGFQEFYLELAKRYGQDGVVDIACGTGAVLLYLAEHGIIRAINEAYGEREELLPELTEALEKALLSGNKAEIDGLTKQMKKLQKKIVSLTDETEQEQVGEEIRSIRERINEFRSFF